MRVVIADDAVLLREGLAGLMQDAGHDVVARVGDGDALLAVVAEHQPDLAVVDVRMPPTYHDEGLVAAATIRAHHTTTAVLVLSQHIETRHAVDLVTTAGGSATCSRTGCSTSTTSSRLPTASHGEARRSTPRSSSRS